MSRKLYRNFNWKEFRYCIETYTVMIELKLYRNWNWNDFENWNNTGRHGDICCIVKLRYFELTTDQVSTEIGHISLIHSLGIYSTIPRPTQPGQLSVDRRYAMRWLHGKCQGRKRHVLRNSIGPIAITPRGMIYSTLAWYDRACSVPDCNYSLSLPRSASRISLWTVFSSKNWDSQDINSGHHRVVN